MELYYACKNGNLEDVKRLLMVTSDVNICDHTFGMTPFNIACKNGHLEIVKYLLLHGKYIDYNKVDRHGCSPLFNACVERHLKVVHALVKDDRININKPTNQNMTPLNMACEAQEPNIVSLLLRHPQIDVNKANVVGKTPIYTACNTGNHAIIRMFLKDNRVNINKSEKYYRCPPFLLACQKCRPETIRLFLKRLDLDINVVDCQGQTAFSNALKNSNLNSCQVIPIMLLKDKRIDLTKQQFHEYIMSPFYKALDSLNYPVIRAMMRDSRVMYFQNGDLPIMKIFYRNKFENTKDIINLCEAYLKVLRSTHNIQDKYGYTILNRVICMDEEYIDLIEYLIGNPYYTDLNIKTIFDKSVYDIALARRWYRTVELLDNYLLSDHYSNKSIGEKIIYLCSNGYIKEAYEMMYPRKKVII